MLEIDCVALIGLYDIMHLLVIHIKSRLLTALAERWHNKTYSFHLLMGEMSITLEDIWRILHIPIIGELVTYDITMGDAALRRIFVAPDLEVHDGLVRWDLYESLPVVLTGIVGGLLCPDRRLHGLSVG